jgi:hypothetical protein
LLEKELKVGKLDRKAERKGMGEGTALSWKLLRQQIEWVTGVACAFPAGAPLMIELVQGGTMMLGAVLIVPVLMLPLLTLLCGCGHRSV